MVLEQNQIVLILALISALSRAGLNIIDRYQIGLQKHSIRSVNFWNNVIPAIMMILAALVSNQQNALGTIFLDWKTALFAAIVQLAAYIFSFAYRYLSVNQVTVAAKLSDLFIPAGLLLTTGYWDWKTFGFAMMTTLVCLPILRGQSFKQKSILKSIALLMCVVLVFQASFSPLLASADQDDWRNAILFATAVIAWRAIWSALPFGWTVTALPAVPRALVCSRLFFFRCGLTVVTQVTFILAVSSNVAAVAWPILNAAGLFAMVLAAIVLEERQAGIEKLIVIAITALAVARLTL